MTMKQLIRLLLISAMLALAASAQLPWITGAQPSRFAAAPSGGSSPVQVGADDFNSYANNASITTGIWASEANGFEVYGQQTYPTSGSWCYMRQTSSYSANQYSTATAVGGAEWTYLGVSVRQQTGSLDCYMLVHSANNTEILLVRVNGGIRTTLQTASNTYASGMKLWLEVTGSGSATRLTAKKDTGSGWEMLWSGVDPGGTYINGGQPGIAGYTSGAVQKLDDWSGGNL